MSTDVAFSALQFPRIRDIGNDGELTGARATAEIHGHAEGYAHGQRLASVERERQRLADDTARAALLAHDRAAAASALSSLAAAADDFSARVLPLIQSVDDSIVRAAIELAEAIIGRELADAERTARGLLERALAAVDLDDVRAVRLNPADLALVTAAVAQDQAVDLGVHLVADDQLAPGDAVVDLPHGFVDARIATATARLRELAGGQSS